MKFLCLYFLAFLFCFVSSRRKNFFKTWNPDVPIARQTGVGADGSPSYTSDIVPTEYFFRINEGKYLIERFISCGGLGCTYIVKLKTGNQRHVLKLAVDPASAANKYLSQQTQADVDIPNSIMEIQNVQACPNVMKIEDVIVFLGNRVALVLEYIDGETLNHYFPLNRGKIDFLMPITAQKERGHPGLQRVSRLLFLQIVRQIIEGYQCIHDIYRRYNLDIKSSNIMITNNNEIKIIDIDGMLDENQLTTVRDGYKQITDVYKPDGNDPDVNANQAHHLDYWKKYDDFTVGLTLCKLLITITNQAPGRPTSFLEIQGHKKLMNKIKVSNYFSNKLDAINRAELNFCVNSADLGSGINFNKNQKLNWNIIVKSLANNNQIHRLSLGDALTLLSKIENIELPRTD